MPVRSRQAIGLISDSVEERRGVLYVNPGSAGPRRFRLPVTVAILEPGEEGFRARIVTLMD